MTSVLIADKDFLTRTGLELLVGELKGFELVPSICGDLNDLNYQISLSKPHLILVNFTSLGMSIADLNNLITLNKKVKFVVFSPMLSMAEFRSILNSKANALLLHECDKSEIMEAINASISKNKFICGKILSLISSEDEINKTNSYIKTLSCEGVAVSEREIDIIVEISLGLSNKQIADKLCLSPHTVNTHRKNIMQKLGVNNTAGIVMFAVKNKLLDNSFI